AERRAIGQGEVGRLPFLLAFLPPLKKAVGREHAAALAERAAVGRTLRSRFGARVDHAVARLRVFGPRRNETPSKEGGGMWFARRFDAHDEHVLGRRDVVARFERRDLLDVEVFGKDVAVAAERETAAHGPPGKEEAWWSPL